MVINEFFVIPTGEPSGAVGGLLVDRAAIKVITNIPIVDTS